MRLQTTEKKAEWAERKNIPWPETCWTWRARDRRLCRGGERCSLACPRQINHHWRDIPKANYMECFLGKSSPRPCKSSLVLAGIRICLGVGGVPVHPSVRWRDYIGMLLWQQNTSRAAFLQKGLVEQNNLCRPTNCRARTLNQVFAYGLQTLYKVE